MSREVKRPWLWMVVGTLVAVAGAVVTLASVPVWLDRGGYRRATPCAEGRTDDCVLDATAVVDRKDVRYRRRGPDEHLVWLDLVHPEIAKPDAGRAVELSEPDRVFDALTSDRAVGVRIWNGRIARVDVPGVGSSETSASPLTNSLELTLSGLGALAGGAGAVWLGADRARGGGRRTGAFAAIGRGLVSSVVGIAVAVLAVWWFEVYHPALLPVAGAVGAGLWWAISRRDRSIRTRSRR